MSREAATKDRTLYLGILGSFAALAVATYFALTIEIFGWEVDITRWMQKFSLGPASFLTSWLFWMGVRGVAGTVLLIAVAVFWLHNRRVEAVFLLLVSIPDLFNLGLRDLIGRPRPSSDMVNVISEGSQGPSFPSGTTLHMLLFYGFLLYLVGRTVQSRLVTYLMWGVGSFYMVGSGVWVVYYGRHWFTDAIGGYVYGAFYLLLLIAAFRLTIAWLEGENPPRLPDAFPPPLRRLAESLIRLLAGPGGNASTAHR